MASTPVEIHEPIDAAFGGMCAAPALIDAPVEEQTRIWAALGEECDEGILICDAEQRILFVNPAFERITGYRAHDAIGKTPRILHSGHQDEQFYSRMWTAVRNTGHWRGEIHNRRKNGALYLEWLSLAAVPRSNGVVTHYIGVFADLTQRQRAAERVRHLANFDALTQLPNRTLLADRLNEVLVAAAKAHSKVGLLFVDLDRFKNINDSMGHEAGDLLLQIVGARLKGLVRRSDVVARMGGDEFAIVLPNITGRVDIDHVAANILAEISKPLVLGNRGIEVSGSIGMCLFPDDASGMSEMMRNADTAMYSAKSLGRNTRQFYTRVMSQHAHEALETETALRRALKQQEFELYYQPQIDLRSGGVLGVEALIRWNRPGCGIVMPGDFIPLAEERGLIMEIGEWTLQAAAKQAAEWERADLPAFTIAVNLSATQFHRDALVERLENILKTTQVAPQRIELEITEGVIVQDAEATIEMLQRLHRLGVALSIDDFGTGYSSLSYLRRFPVDKIKIDRSFVNEMVLDVSAGGIVRGIVELAHGLKLQVIAEGVETLEQLQKLRELHCDQAQGFLVSRPLPAAECERFLREWPDRWDTLLGAPETK